MSVRRPPAPFGAFAAAAVLAGLLPALAAGQSGDLPGFLSGGLSDSFGLKATGKPEVTVSAALAGPAGDPLAAGDLEPGDEVTLAVTATIPDGFYLVSQTSPAGDPAELILAETNRLEPAGTSADGPPFVPGRAPKAAFNAVYNGILEKFTGSVTWTRRFRVTAGDGPVRAAGELRGSYCSTGAGGVCVKIFPGDKPFSATLGGNAGSDFLFEATPERRGAPGPVAVRVTLPRGAAVGETVDAAVTLDVAEGHHVYAAADAGEGAIPTGFKLAAVGLEPAGDVTAAAAPKLKTKGAFTLREHYGASTWTRPYVVTAAEYGLAGSVRYQVCTDDQCLLPKTVTFAVGAADDALAATAEPAPVAPWADGTGETAAPGGVELADSFAAADANPLAALGLWAVIPAAFAAGLLLNVMPCVLPVIAIKVMSFVQQAGESRRAILALNLWYTLGVLSVFMTFAALSLGAGVLLGGDGDFTWGEHLDGAPFKIGMTALVFAMALSMLGLYEIPVPGFVGAAAGSNAGQKEGGLGAFLSGVFTTLLATPCTGPLMVPVLAFAATLAATNPIGSAGVWAAMGVGFASPYLIFGLTPGASRFLPRPGNWMVRFKEFGGLVLIATSLWLMSGLDYSLWLPVLVGLLGLATGLWVVGRLMAHSDRPARKWTLRGVGLATAGAGIAVAVWLTPTVAVGDGGVADSEAWEPFSTARLNELRASGRTVLIEFTSATCVNCRINERVALDTAASHEAFETLGVTPMKAWTDRSDEAKDWLEKTGGYGVPHNVIFPGDRPNDPIILTGLMSQGQLLEALETAAAPKPVRTAGR